MNIGSIVFGPIPSSPERPREDYLKSLKDGLQGKTLGYHACHCIGPQPGQTKCPCALAGEAEMGRKMIEEGVTINGKRYRLVPE